MFATLNGKRRFLPVRDDIGSRRGRHDQQHDDGAQRHRYETTATAPQARIGTGRRGHRASIDEAERPDSHAVLLYWVDGGYWVGRPTAPAAATPMGAAHRGFSGGSRGGARPAATIRAMTAPRATRPLKAALSPVRTRSTTPRSRPAASADTRTTNVTDPGSGVIACFGRPACRLPAAAVHLRFLYGGGRSRIVQPRIANLERAGGMRVEAAVCYGGAIFRD